MLLALAQRFLGAFAFLNLAVQFEIDRRQFIVSLRKGRVEFGKPRVCLAKAALRRFERRDRFHEESFGRCGFFGIVLRQAPRR